MAYPPVLSFRDKQRNALQNPSATFESIKKTFTIPNETNHPEFSALYAGKLDRNGLIREYKSHNSWNCTRQSQVTDVVRNAVLAVLLESTINDPTRRKKRYDLAREALSRWDDPNYHGTRAKNATIVKLGLTRDNNHEARKVLESYLTDPDSQDQAETGHLSSTGVAMSTIDSVIDVCQAVSEGDLVCELPSMLPTRTLEQLPENMRGPAQYAWKTTREIYPQESKPLFDCDSLNKRETRAEELRSKLFGNLTEIMTELANSSSQMTNDTNGDLLSSVQNDVTYISNRLENENEEASAFQRRRKYIIDTQDNTNSSLPGTGNLLEKESSKFLRMSQALRGRSDHTSSGRRHRLSRATKGIRSWWLQTD
ncbi:uncharacterized protein L201_003691 [Kwoniella dendrophila CBS 6074]|uniref:Uncharacterized protein n=1 Tax=Kwoniella dendrophila CBS 6074 TaxID=1295534 RepID=A0AAX4JVE1_9TREE